MTIKKYCRKCGRKLVDVGYNSYNEETGKKVHDLICPNIKCEAHCDFFGHKWIRLSSWHNDVKCENCGYVPHYW